MPPAGNRRPDNTTYDAVASLLETELDRVATAHVNPGRPANLHRLNRTEYANAVRDLTGIEVDASALLPPDQQAHGFDTNADALLMAPALLDRYLNAAAKIARIAIGDPTIPPAFERYTAVKGNSNEQTWLWQTDRLSEDFPLGSRGGIAVRHYFPVDGEYILKLRLQRTYQDVIRGLNEPNQIEIRVDGVRVAQFKIGGSSELISQALADYRDVRPGDITSGDDALQVRVPLKAGLKTVVATIVKSNDILPEGLGPARIPIWSREGDVPTVPAYISSLLIGGPYNASGAEGLTKPQANLRMPARKARLTRPHARQRFCRHWSGARIAGRQPMKMFRCCSVSTRLRGRARTSMPAFAPRWSASWSAPIFSSGSRPIPSMPLPVRSIAFPTSNWHRACRSSCGAVAPTTNC